MLANDIVILQDDLALLQEDIDEQLLKVDTESWILSELQTKKRNIESHIKTLINMDYLLGD